MPSRSNRNAGGGTWNRPPSGGCCVTDMAATLVGGHRRQPFLACRESVAGSPAPAPPRCHADPRRRPRTPRGRNRPARARSASSLVLVAAELEEDGPARAQQASARPARPVRAHGRRLAHRQAPGRGSYRGRRGAGRRTPRSARRARRRRRRRRGPELAGQGIGQVAGVHLHPVGGRAPAGAAGRCRWPPPGPGPRPAQGHGDRSGPGAQVDRQRRPSGSSSMAREARASVCHRGT